MITGNQAVKLIREFIFDVLPSEVWFQKINPHVKAIILYGSVAKGVNREDSDVDVLIILPLKIEDKYTVGEYFYDFRGYQINIVVRSIERLRTIANEAKDKFQKEVFRNSILIDSKDGEVESLLNKISKIT